MLNLLKRPNVLVWLLLLAGAVLPWVVSGGLWEYGMAVPESVEKATWELVSTVSFVLTALAILIVVFLPKVYRAPRFLAGFVALLYFMVGFTAFPHYMCGPRYVGVKAKQQQAQANTKSNTVSCS